MAKRTPKPKRTARKTSSPTKGERLYNGIVLPKEWPPRLTDAPKDPMTPAYLVSPPAVIPIDVGRQLFVDDFLVESSTLKRTYYVADYYPGNPVFRNGMPFSDGVWYDPQDKIVKMWYMRGGTSYAISEDGIHWKLPVLDVKPGTNVVQTGARDSSTVWLDLEEKNPTRRYKMFRSVIGGGCRYVLHFSADGIHWGEPILMGSACGDRSTVFWNPFRKVWVYSIRHGWTDERRRRYWEVRDLLKDPYWKKEADAPYWTGADSRDIPRADYGIPTQLYNLDGLAYESLMLGFFSIWYGQPPPRPKPNQVLLGFSRDGWSWYRPDRRPFCGVSENPEDWNYGNVQSVVGACLVMGDTLYFYVSGRSKRGGVTGLATLRRDGFASVDASAETGTLTTRPVRFKGKYLFVNLDCPHGELRAEALDAKGNVIAPFSADRCRPLSVNKTLQAVTWKGAKDLSPLAGKNVRFRFHLRNGRLYAFWVGPDTSGASHGYIGAGGPGFTGPTDTVGIKAYRAVNPSPPKDTAVSPVIWPKSGVFTKPVAVRLSLPLSDADPQTAIRYTVGGAAPTEASSMFSGPFQLGSTAAVKARSFKKGLKPSDTVAAEIRIVPKSDPPKRLNGKPTLRVWDGPSEVTISLETNENATCRYATAPGIAYEHMPFTFSNTGGMQHSTKVSGLKPETTHTFYVKSQDVHGNSNDDDFVIKFLVTRAPYVPFRADLDVKDAKPTRPMALHRDRAHGGYAASPVTEKGLIAFKVSAPAEDEYVIWTWVMGPTSAEDSFHVSVDGGPEDVFDLNERTTPGTYHWERVNGRAGSFPMTLNPRLFTLPKGEHSILFRAREPNARLYKLIVTNDHTLALA